MQVHSCRENLDCIRIWTLLNPRFVELDSIRIWTIFELCFYSRLYRIAKSYHIFNFSLFIISIKNSYKFCIDFAMFEIILLHRKTHLVAAKFSKSL